MADEDIKNKIDELKEKLEELKRLILEENKIFNLELKEKDKKIIKDYITQKEMLLKNILEILKNEKTPEYEKYLKNINNYTHILIKLIKNEIKEIGDEQIKKTILEEINLVETEIKILNKIKEKFKKLEFIKYLNNHIFDLNKELDENEKKRRIDYLNFINLKYTNIKKEIINEIISNKYFKYFLLVEEIVESKSRFGMFGYGFSEILRQEKVIKLLIKKEQFTEFLKKLVEITKIAKSGNLWEMFRLGIAKILQQKESIKLLIEKDQFNEFFEELIEISKNTNFENIKVIFYYEISEILNQLEPTKLLIEKNRFIEFIKKNRINLINMDTILVIIKLYDEIHKFKSEEEREKFFIEQIRKGNMNSIYLYKKYKEYNPIKNCLFFEKIFNGIKRIKFTSKQGKIYLSKNTNFLYRVYKKKRFDLWKKAYEINWDDEEFNYNPIEPICRYFEYEDANKIVEKLEKNKNGMITEMEKIEKDEVLIYTKIIGMSVNDLIKFFFLLYKKEAERIGRFKFTINKILTKNGINHGDLIFNIGNICIDLHDKDEKGDYKLYLIDFGIVGGHNQN
jgi:hypothetical protein